MEGSVVWVNMFGELWRASVEQTRDATTEEKLGVEVVAENFGEMQERLRRGSHQQRFVFGKLEPLNEVGVSFNGRRLKQSNHTIFIDMQGLR